MFTRSQIDAIAAGTTEIAFGIDGQFGVYKPVVSIHAKQDDIAGKLFVCGYIQYSEGAIMSFSVKEGDATDFRHYRIDNGAAA